MDNRVSGLELGILAEADASRLRANRVSGSGDGIVVFGDGNSVAENNVSDSTGCGDPACGVGITIDGGSGNVVTGNDVRRTSGDGIRVAAFDPGVPTTGTIASRNVVSRARRRRLLSRYLRRGADRVDVPSPQRGHSCR